MTNNTNKTKLIDNDGFQTYVEVIDCVKPENYKTLRFTTVFSRSRHPQGEREAYQITLPPDAYSRLIDLLTKDDTPETMAEIFSRIP
jgi:hypothetical protein